MAETRYTKFAWAQPQLQFSFTRNDSKRKSLFGRGSQSLLCTGLDYRNHHICGVKALKPSFVLKDPTGPTQEDSDQSESEAAGPLTHESKMFNGWRISYTSIKANLDLRRKHRRAWLQTSFAFNRCLSHILQQGRRKRSHAHLAECAELTAKVRHERRERAKILKAADASK